MEKQKMIIDGENLFISGLVTHDDYSEDGIWHPPLLTADSVKTALRPVVAIGKAIKKSMQELTPDEVELTLELQMGVENEHLVFALVNTSAEAHISVKFVWKSGEN